MTFSTLNVMTTSEDCVSLQVAISTWKRGKWNLFTVKQILCQGRAIKNRRTMKEINLSNPWGNDKLKCNAQLKGSPTPTVRWHSEMFRFSKPARGKKNNTGWNIPTTYSIYPYLFQHHLVCFYGGSYKKAWLFYLTQLLWVKPAIENTTESQILDQIAWM